MWYWNDHMGWWMLLEGAVWLLFWGGILWFVLSLARAPRRPDSAEDPLDIARQRYARGEIDRATFEELTRDLAANLPQARRARFTPLLERTD